MNFTRDHALRVQLLAAFLAACARSPDKYDEVSASGTRAATSASASSAPTHRAGENPFALESQPLHAKVGDFALLPSPGSLKEAFRSDAPRVRLVYTRALLDELGPLEAHVRWLSQQRGFVANALVIPLSSDELVRRGDIVLTLGAFNGGLERAVVVSEGATRAPSVRSLDEIIPSTADRVLEPGSFAVLNRDDEPGVTLACRAGDRYEPFVLGASASDRLLAVGFAGLSALFEASQCRRLPLAPIFKPGERVFVPLAGHFIAAQVKARDAAPSRVHVSYEFASEPREASVAEINVAKDLAH
jgi:hypothetical protein